MHIEKFSYLDIIVHQKDIFDTALDIELRQAG